MSSNAPHDACSYCGLPLPDSWWGKKEPAQAPAFCCVGCRIASSVTQAQGAEGHTRWLLARLGLAIFFTMNVMVFAMALWSRDVYFASDSAAAPGALADTLWQLFRYLGLLFSLPVLLLLGGPIVENTWDALRRGAITTDLLILLGVAAAYIYSVISVLSGDGHVYFEVACMVLVMVTLGRWLEATGKLKTTQALDSLAQLLPDEVKVIRDGRTLTVSRDSVARGERLRVEPGERFAVDGRIVEGEAEIDEQLISGESRAVIRGSGEPVCSGTLNVDGDIVVEITAAAGAETVSRMIEMVREAREAKGSYQRAADRVAHWFVPIVSLLAVLVTWYHAQQSGLEYGILAGLAVVLIACPCALGLATPMAVWTALSRAARAQVLFRSGAVVERLAGVRAVRFDKTGTLTTGQADVELFEADGDREKALDRAATLAAVSTHSLSQAITEYAGETISGQPLRDVKTTGGKGVSAVLEFDNEPCWLGSVEYMRDADLRFSDRLSELIQTTGSASPLACVGWDAQVRGVFLFREQLRDNAADTLAQCRQAGLDVAVLTGDRPGRGELLADALQTVVQSGLLPADKLAAIRGDRARHGEIAMIGDGVNDAPALAAADVGIAMGCGADIARNTADVCLLSNDLTRIPWSIDLARRTVRVIRQNLIWAFAYNFVGIVLAASGKLNPIWAAVAMALSSFFVVSNSLRLAGNDEQQAATPKEATSGRAMQGEAQDATTDSKELLEVPAA